MNPFKIIHINLEQCTQQPLSILTGQEGYYLVFWWKTIPLGELFVESGEKLEKEQLNEKIIEVIMPAIDSYCKHFTLPRYRYQGRLNGCESDILSETLEAIHNILNPGALPQTVPISTVICTRNRSRQLKSCLDSLQRLPYRPEEIIVVDNAPSDNSTEQLVAQYQNVIYCKEQHPGLDIARNAGAYKASCAIVAYIDDDVVIHPLWAYRTWQTFLDKHIDAMTGLVITSALDTEAQYIFEKYWSFNRGYVDKIYDASYFAASGKPEVWEIGAGANMAFRKTVLEVAGYFDERLDVGAAGCNGDSEMWYRILAKGYTIQYNPRAVVYHQHRSELKALQKQLYNYMRGHVTAALIQQAQNNKASYRKYVYGMLPRYYLASIKAGFPKYSAFRYRTLWSEVRGVISGMLYFNKHRNKPAISITYSGQ